MRFLRCSLRAWTLACLAVLFCLAAPAPRALAQGAWQTHLRYKLNESWSPEQWSGALQQSTREGDVTSLVHGSGYYSNGYKRESGSSSDLTCTVEVVLEWVPAYAPMGPPAGERERLSLKINAQAMAINLWDAGYSPSNRVSADNGLGSPARSVPSSASSSILVSEGSRLLLAPVTRDADGVWRARAGSYTLGASASIDPLGVTVSTGGYPGGGYPGGGYPGGYPGGGSTTKYIWESARTTVSLTVVRDTRAVTISSSYDPTYHREVIDGVPTRVANVPDATGTVRADTRGNDPIVPGSSLLEDLFNGLGGSQAIAYHGNYAGDWSTTWTEHNRYLWTFSLGLPNDATSGAWDPSSWGPPVIPGPGVHYPAADSRGMPGQVEQVHLKATAIDGVVAEADYILTFHKPYEFIRVIERRQFPQLPVREHLSEWEYLTAIENPGGQPITVGVQAKRGNGGLLSWSLGSGGDAAQRHIAELAAAYLQAPGDSLAPAVVVPLTVPARTRRFFYQGLSRQSVRGESSLWDTSGYYGDVSWDFTATSGVWTIAPDPTQDVGL